MRALTLSTAIILATFVSAAACTQPLQVGDGTSSAAASTTGSKAKNSQTSSSSSSSDDDDDDSTGASTGAGKGTDAGASSGDDDDSTLTPTGPTGTPSAFACSGAGIAAYADALVKAGRQDCTSDGVGVVKNDNYQCVKTAITSCAPPHPDTSYSIVTTLLAPNKDFPDLECTYFIQMVTSGVCGTPLSPVDMKWTDYPYACEFINKAPAGWTWFDNSGNSADVQLGDIFVYNSSDGCNQDPGHIMIVAELKSGGKFRIAEANELNSNGSEATGETGVMSNSRVTTLNDSEQSPAGWFRLNAQ